MAQTHIDYFEELYILGFRSPLAPQPFSRNDPLPFFPTLEPRCMVGSCGTEENLIACNACGLVFACNDHRQKLTSENAHMRDCGELRKAKVSLAAWSERFRALFSEYPQNIFFDRQLLKLGKDLDRLTQNRALSEELVSYKTRDEVRDEKRWVCLGPDCTCDGCTLGRHKARNPHQQALDGYCEAFCRVSYKLFKLVRRAKSGLALRQIIRMDMQAYRQGISGDLGPDALFWILAAEDPKDAVPFCWNALLSEEIHTRTVDHTTPTAATLDGTKLCSPNGARNVAYGFLDPVGRGSIFRGIESKTHPECNALLAPLPTRHGLNTWQHREVTKRVELRLIMNFHALEAFESAQSIEASEDRFPGELAALEAVQSIECLKDRLPRELILQIQEASAVEIPTIGGSEVMMEGVRLGLDIHSQFQRALQSLYDHIDENHHEAFPCRNHSDLDVWMPRFMPLISKYMKNHSERFHGLQQVLASMPRLEAWIEKQTFERYPRLAEMLRSPDLSLEPLTPEEMYREAAQDRFGDLASELRAARSFFNRTTRAWRPTYVGMDTAASFIFIDNSSWNT